MGTELEHVAIRRPQFVAGSKNKPEVGVFVQTNKVRSPLNTDLLEPGQRVWMKWVGGPIIADSKILSWHTGVVVNGNISEVRELTLGTGLFALDCYWESVAEKKNCQFTVVRLAEEKWLEDLIYPKARSRSSWVYLKTQEDKEVWLTNTTPPPSDRADGRRLPSRLRFAVLRRDNFTCQYCGQRAPRVRLHVDHRVPWKEVKSHDIENLVTACMDCNLGKGSSTLVSGLGE